MRDAKKPSIAVYFEHLFPESRGGGERLYGTLAQRWAERGAHVTYLTRSHAALEPPVSRDFEVSEIASAGGVYREDGTRSTGGAVAFALATLRTTRRRRSLDDCVIVSSTPAFLVFAARAGMFPRRGRVLMVDWLEVWTRRQWTDYLGTTRGLLAWVVQVAAVWATPVATCHSRLMERRLRKIRPGLRVLVSPGLIDDGGVPAEAIPTSAASPPYALVVGRLIEDKNVATVPEAIARARESVPDLRCTIVGSGPEREKLDELISRLGLQDCVTVTSSLTEADLAGAMAGAACLLHPSRREGYGLVVVEASRHGTPAVVIDAPDNAAVELVDDGVNGVLVPSADPADLAAGVVLCLAGGQPLRQSTRAWYEHARRNRSVHRTADNMLDFIVAELARKPPQASP